MGLVAMQSRFLSMAARLVLHAEQLGYVVTGGDLYRDPRTFGEDGAHPYSHEHSLHRERLAIDLNIFLDGAYLVEPGPVEPLGTYWESLGGTWGGRFIPPDTGHFSLPYGGMK
jgi:hypothetical protein